MTKDSDSVICSAAWSLPRRGRGAAKIRPGPAGALQHWSSLYFVALDRSQSAGLLAWAILCLFMLFIPCGSAKVKSSARGQEVLDEVQADVLAKRWEQAQATLDAAAPKLEGSSRFHFLRATLLLHRQELTRALEEVDRALRIDPRQARYYLLRGQVYDQTGNQAAAELDYQKNIELDPENEVGVLLLVRIQIQQRLLTDALSVLESAVKRMPTSVAVHSELGEVLENLRRPREALASYARAAALNPRFAPAHAGLGRLYRDNPETLARSLEHLSQAVTLEPQNSQWRYELGVTYLRQGDLKSARGALEEAAKLNSRDPRVYSALAGAYRRLEMPEKAAEAELRSFALTQKSEEEIHHLAQLEADFTRAQQLERSGQSQEAIELYQQILKASPEEPQVYFALARLYLDAGRAGLAQEYIRRALGHRPNNADYHQLHAMVLTDLSRLGEAEQELRTAILLKPKDGASYNALGNLLLREGRDDDAVAALQQAVQLAPDEPGYRLDLSNAYQRKGDPAAAEREYAVYRKLMKLQPAGPK